MILQRFFLAFAAFLLLTSCLNDTDTNSKQEAEHDSEIKAPEGTEKENEEKEPAGEEIVDESNEEEGETSEDEQGYSNPKEVAEKIVNLLAEKDMEALSKFVHPKKGVRFSPYGYVDVESDQTFTAEEVNGLMEDDTVYIWGVYDGKGNPIELTFTKYYERFIYDQDFANAEEISVDERLGHGNTIDNTEDVYPDGTVVEFYFSGFDPDFVGMDWRSLRLVLEEDSGQWYLVSVIHDEWTI